MVQPHLLRGDEASRGHHSAKDPAAPARNLLYVALALSSFLVLRVAGFTASDFFLAASALWLLVAGLFEPRLRASPLLPDRDRLLYTVTGLCIACAAAIASFRSDDVPENYLVALRLLVLAIMAPILSRKLFRNTSELGVAANSFAVGAAVCGFCAILQAAVDPGIIPGALVTNAYRFTGATSSVSDLGGISCLAVAFALPGFSRSRRERNLLSLLILSGGLAGVILSGSVSAFIAVAAAIVVVVVQRTVPVGRLAVTLLFFLVPGYLIYGFVTGTDVALTPVERVQQVVGLTSVRGAAESTNTLETRVATWRAGIDGIVHQPFFGRGLDAMSGTVFERFQVHNLILGALYQGGILLGVGLTVLLCTAMSRSRRGTAAFTQLDAQISAMTIASIVFAMTGPSLFNRYLWLPIVLQMAAHALRYSNHVHPETPYSRNGIRRTVAT